MRKIYFYVVLHIASTGFQFYLAFFPRGRQLQINVYNILSNIISEISA